MKNPERIGNPGKKKEPPLAPAPYLVYNIKTALRSVGDRAAAPPREAQARLMDIAVEALRSFLAGRPVSAVNG